MFKIVQLGGFIMVCFERMSRIMDILTKRKIISTFQLEALMYCSTSTLRRDLIKLEKEGKIIRSLAKFDLLLQTILNTLTTAEAMKKLRENNKLQKRPPLS